MIKVALFGALVGILLLMLFRNKLNLSTIFIATISFAVVSFCAIIGLNMKSTPLFFALHNISVMAATGAILYYLITKKYLLPLILLPVFMILLYIATAYASLTKNNILFG